MYQQIKDYILYLFIVVPKTFWSGLK